MVDQAHALRTLMEQRRAIPNQSEATSNTSSAKFLAITAAKGGVGKTTLALQTAIALQQSGQRVCVWDVDGTASHDLLMGFHHAWSISHLLTGARTAHEILSPGKEGVQFLLGNGISNLTTALLRESTVLETAINQWEQHFDVLILDLPGANSGEVRSLMKACQSAWLVCSPEPTAVAASYSFIKTAPELLGQTSVVVNHAASAEDAFDVIDRLQQTTKLFLQQDVEAAGYVPEDSSLNQFHNSTGHGREAVHQLSNRWLALQKTTQQNAGFVERFCPDLQPAPPVSRAA